MYEVIVTVLVFGTFDVIHPGHVSFLKQAREHGDRLIVSVARDIYVNQWKSKQPVHSEEERRRHLLESGLVDDAVLGDETQGTYSILERVKPDVICFGHDQDKLKHNLADWLSVRRTLFPAVEIATLAAFQPEIYKSSKLNRQRQSR